MQRSDLFRFDRVLFVLAPVALAAAAVAQSTSGVVTGTAKDSTGAVVPNATVSLVNRGTGYSRSTVSDAAGRYTFTNIPFDRYQVSASANGLNAAVKQVQVSSAVPLTLDLSLAVAGTSAEVDVQATGDLTETNPNFHTDVDRAMIARLPEETPSSE